MHVYFAISGMNWGKGKSLKEAHKNMKKLGSSIYGNPKHKMFLVYEVKDFDKIGINDMMQVYYQHGDRLILESEY